MTPSVPLTIVAGYLGAGKTTLVNHLIQQVSGVRLAVLVNDFGALNIDAELIASRNSQTIQLENGCICCSLGGGLYDALDRLLTHPELPEGILIEASGVAEPDKLADIARAEPELSLDAVVCVVDAETVRERVKDPQVGSILRRQIQSADLLLLNKIDLVSSSEKEALECWISEQNPRASQAQAEQAQVPVEWVIGAHFEKEDPQTKHAPKFRILHEELFSRWHRMEEPSCTVAELRAALEHLPEGVHRLKGWIAGSSGVLEVQAVGARYEIRERPGARESSRLVAIGPSDVRFAERLDAWFDKWLAFGDQPG